MKHTTHSVAVAVMVVVLVSLSCITPVTAGSYSITQSSQYKYPGEVVDHILKPFGINIHADLTEWHDPDVTSLKSVMRSDGWTENFHHTNAEVTVTDFTSKLDTSDIHFHMGHGFDGGLKLYNYPLRGSLVTAADVNGKWTNCKWVALYSCSSLNDNKWRCAIKNGGHGVLGFVTPAYTNNAFLTDFATNLTQGFPVSEAWYKTSKEKFGKIDEPIIACGMFRNKELHDNDGIRVTTQPIGKFEPYIYTVDSKGNGKEISYRTCIGPSPYFCLPDDCPDEDEKPEL